MGGLPGWAWFSSMLGTISFMLPFFAFGVTKDWKKTMECFGLQALITKGLIFFAKAIIYLLITSPTPEASQAIMSAAVSSCMGACFMACTVLSFISHKSLHGQKRHMVNWCWLVLMTFLVGAGMIMYLIKERQQAGDMFLAFMISFIILVQLRQAGRPLLMRTWSSHGVIRDEAPVLFIKIVAILITIVTSTYSCWSTWSSLKPHVTHVSLLMHLAMCVTGTIAGILQLLMRIINAQNKLEAFFEKIWTTTKRGWQFVMSCLDTVIEGTKRCVAAICSCFRPATQWLKRLLGLRP